MLYKRGEATPVMGALLLVLSESFRRRKQLILKGTGTFQVKRDKSAADTHPNGELKNRASQHKIVLEQNQACVRILDPADKYPMNDHLLTLFFRQNVIGPFASKDGQLLQQL